MAGEVNLCLATYGGTLEDSATEGMRDGNFAYPNVLSVNHQGGGTGYAYIYLRIDGDWGSPIATHTGSGCCGWSWGNAPTYVYEVSTGWQNVTGIRMTCGDTPVQTASITFPRSTVSYIRYGTNGNGNNDVIRSYGCELQAWGRIDTKVQVIQH
jgi:hypothetical protein